MKYLVQYIKYMTISFINHIRYGSVKRKKSLLSFDKIACILGISSTNLNIDSSKKYFVCYKNMMYYRPSIVFEDILTSEAAKKAIVRQGGIIISNKSEDNRKIYVDSYSDAYLELCENCRTDDVTIVAVTGSTGKTTAKQFCSKVLAQGGKTFCAEHNMNTYRFSGSLLQMLNKDVKFYVQEVDEGDPGLAGYASNMLKPNFAIVTNVGLSHSKNFESQDKIRDNIVEIENGMVNNQGVILYNYDDLMLRNYNWNVNNISVSLFDNRADCYCSNIVVEGDGVISFDMNFRGIKTNLKISVPGLHNIYNALYASIIASEVGIDECQIKKGLLNYKPTGVRQNMIKSKKALLYVDCFNAAPASMIASLDTIESMNTKSEVKKVAVLGDMSEFGDISKKIHQDVGNYINELNTIDYVLCYGKESINIAKSINNNRIKVYHTEQISDIIKTLKDLKKDKLLILFKGSRCMKLERIIKAVYPLSYLKILSSDVMLFHDI